MRFRMSHPHLYNIHVANMRVTVAEQTKEAAARHVLLDREYYDAANLNYASVLKARREDPSHPNRQTLEHVVDTIAIYANMCTARLEQSLDNQKIAQEQLDQAKRDRDYCIEWLKKYPVSNL